MEQIIGYIKNVTHTNKKIIELSEANFTALKNQEFDKIHSIEVEMSLLEKEKGTNTETLVNAITEKAKEYNEPTPRISYLVPYVESEELLKELLVAVDEMENTFEQLTAVLLRNIQYAKLVMEIKNDQIETLIDFAEHEGYNKRGALIVEQEL